MSDDQCHNNNNNEGANDAGIGSTYNLDVKQDTDESSQVQIKTEQIEEDKDDNNEDKSEKTNLIVNYLPQNMTDEQFEDLFKKFGATKSCKIVRNRISGFSYGFGFVDFETHEQALKAIDELNGHELENKKIKVAFARPAGQDIKQANLYIKNVPNTWTQDDVRKVFEPYGNIIQVRVLGNNRGVAFVLYDLRKQAEDALDALNGKQVEGCEAPFEIKFAADKKVEKTKSGNQSNNLGNNSNRSRSQGQGQGQHQRNSSHGRQNSNNNDRDNFRNQRGGFNDRQRRGQNNNNDQYDPNGPFNQRNNEIGPLKQAPINRLARYAPFVSAQQPMAQLRSPLAQPMAQLAPNPLAYGYQQQQMIPFSLMTAQNQLGAMQAVNPVSALAATANQQVGMYGAPQTTIPIQYAPIPQNAMSNIYNVATNHLTNAANMQPQLSQNLNMRGIMGNQLYNSNHNNNNNHSNNNNNMNNNHNNSTGTGGGDGCTLFVYNIGPDSDENELRTLFSPFGQVVKCNVVRKTPGGETKGFGFVTLTERGQATAAIAGLNGTTRNNRTLQVSMKK